MKPSSGASRPCDRCRHRPAFARFVAGNKPALKFRGGSFQLCAVCLASLGDFVGRGDTGAAVESLSAPVPGIPPWIEAEREEKPGRACETRPGESKGVV